jgi:hypothetical protein
MNLKGTITLYKSLPLRERYIIWIGVILVSIVIIGTVKTSKCLTCLSTDLDVWKDRAEFISLVLGPYIAGVGLYYVWHSVRTDQEKYAVEFILQGFNGIETKLNNFDNSNLVSKEEYRSEVYSLISDFTFISSSIKKINSEEHQSNLYFVMFSLHYKLRSYLVKSNGIRDIDGFTTINPKYAGDNSFNALIEEFLQMTIPEVINVESK